MPLDPTTLHAWYPIAALDEIVAPGRTVLLDTPLTFSRAGVRRATGESLPSLEEFGYLWTSLGTPRAPLFEIAEYAEQDRRRFNAGSIGVCTSAPRAIENFLDMGHFPFVHVDILGAEPQTEVKPYDVAISPERPGCPGSGELLATRCRFFQPKASTAAKQGFEVEYMYRVPHPTCAILYKSSALDPARRDVIGLFAQPMGEEKIRAHMLICVLDAQSSDTQIKHFQQIVFGQDKPILENQVPRRLPLAPLAELSIGADRASVLYRRWLTELGITYGVIA